MKKIMLISRNFQFLNEFINKFSVIYEIKYSYKPLEVKSALRNEIYSCILLDVSKIEIEAASIVRRMRKFFSIPIIVISSQDKYKEIIKIIESGADDYVLEPINYIDLNNRIEIRTIKYGNVLEFEDLAIDKEKKKVTYKNKEIALTSYEFEILLILASNAGFPYTKTELYKLVWHTPNDISIHTVQSHIFTLRKKIFHVTNKDYIKTYWKKGYIFEYNTLANENDEDFY